MNVKMFLTLYVIL